MSGEVENLIHAKNVYKLLPTNEIKLPRTKPGTRAALRSTEISQLPLGISYDQRGKMLLPVERGQVNWTIIEKYNRMVKEGSVYSKSKKYPNPLMGMINVQSDFD